MSTTYTYEGLTPDPCVQYIFTQVYYGAIEGQMDIGDIGWEGGSRTLTVHWGHELTAGQKALLDAVVADSLGKVRVSKERVKIMDEIFWTAFSEGGFPRVITLCDGLDKVPSLLAALDNFNYPLAHQRLGYALAQGWISQADHDLAASRIPPNEYE